MNTIEALEETANLVSTPADNTAAGSPLAEKAKSKPVKFEILGNTVFLDDFRNALSKAKTETGRVNKIAEKYIEDQIAAESIDKTTASAMRKNICGGGDFLPTMQIVNKLHRDGKLAEKKERSEEMIKAVKGLNMLIDAFELLGLAKRQSSVK